MSPSIGQCCTVLCSTKARLLPLSRSRSLHTILKPVQLGRSDRKHWLFLIIYLCRILPLVVKCVFVHNLPSLIICSFKLFGVSFLYCTTKGIIKLFTSFFIINHFAILNFNGTLTRISFMKNNLYSKFKSMCSLASEYFLNSIYYISDCTLLPVEKNLVDLVWKEQPNIRSNPVLYLEQKFSGVTVADKWKDVKNKMSDKKACALVITALDEIACK